MIEHFFISVPFCGGYGHCYLMTDDRKNTEIVINKLYYEGEKQGLKPHPLPIVLVTYLKNKDEYQEIRDFIAPRYPEAAANWAKAKNFHVTMFFEPEGTKEHDFLMEQH